MNSILGVFLWCRGRLFNLQLFTYISGLVCQKRIWLRFTNQLPYTNQTLVLVDTFSYLGLFCLLPISMHLPNTLAFKWGHFFFVKPFLYHQQLGTFPWEKDRKGMCPGKQLIVCPQIQLFAIMIGIWDPDNATFPCPDLFKQYGRPKGTPASPKQP